MLKIYGPTELEPKLVYALNFVFSDVFGLDWQYFRHDRNDYSIGLTDSECEIYFPAILLPQLYEKKDIKHMISGQYVQVWKTQNLGLNFNITSPNIPVLFQKELTLATKTETAINLPIDIFSSVFFMLSNYEDLTVKTRDVHGRMPAQLSLSYQFGFLSRPLIDEYINILWSCMSHFWPKLTRKPEPQYINITCDVDRAYELGYGAKDFLRGIKSDFYRDFKPVTGLAHLKKRMAYLNGNFKGDAFVSNIQEMMRIAEKENQNITFYFLCGGNHSLDGYYTLTQSIIKKLMQDIHARGHQIGIHGSYQTHNNPHLFNQEVERIRTSLDDLNIPRDHLHARQHYLRWDPLVTPVILENHHITSDSSLAFADHAGFRCGTSRSFKMYDLANDRQLNLIQHPLIMMETTIFDARYQNFSHDAKALDYMVNLKKTSLNMGKQFTYLWHNCSFDQKEWFEDFQILARS